MLPNDLLSSVVTLDEMIHSEAFENDCYNFQYKIYIKEDRIIFSTVLLL